MVLSMNYSELSSASNGLVARSRHLPRSARYATERPLVDVSGHVADVEVIIGHTTAADITAVPQG
jgi:hypothetical protein